MVTDQKSMPQTSVIPLLKFATWADCDIHIPRSKPRLVGPIVVVVAVIALAYGSSLELRRLWSWSPVH